MYSSRLLFPEPDASRDLEMLPKSSEMLSWRDVESSRSKLSEEETVSPPPPEEQLTDMPAAGKTHESNTIRCREKKNGSLADMGWTSSANVILTCDSLYKEISACLPENRNYVNQYFLPILNITTCKMENKSHES
jgi:hypothetical protein